MERVYEGVKHAKALAARRRRGRAALNQNEPDAAELGKPLGSGHPVVGCLEISDEDGVCPRRET